MLLLRSSKISFFSPSKKYKDKTAVLLRAWQGIEYTSDLLQSVRSMISELSLHTGGEYSVYLVVETMDKDGPILASPGSGANQKLLDDIVPRELRNEMILFNQDLLKAWYPTIDQGGGHSSHMNQPLQLFFIINPDFTFVWQFKLDVSYTGNWYNFLESAESWARRQPRKLQWERAAKFFFSIPSYCGSYANLSDSVEAALPAQTVVSGAWYEAGPFQDFLALNLVGRRQQKMITPVASAKRQTSPHYFPS